MSHNITESRYFTRSDNFKGSHNTGSFNIPMSHNIMDTIIACCHKSTGNNNITGSHNITLFTETTSHTITESHNIKAPNKTSGVHNFT